MPAPAAKNYNVSYIHADETEITDEPFRDVSTIDGFYLLVGDIVGALDQDPAEITLHRQLELE